MHIFWKAVGGTLVASVFGMVLSKRNPDMGILLNLAVSTMLLLLGLGFLGPVLDFFRTLEIHAQRYTFSNPEGADA